MTDDRDGPSRNSWALMSILAKFSLDNVGTWVSHDCMTRSTACTNFAEPSIEV